MIRISTPNKVISRVCYDAIPMRYTQCYEVHIPCRVRSGCEFNEDAKPCNILVNVQLRVPQIQKGSIHSALVSFAEFWSGNGRYVVVAKLLAYGANDKTTDLIQDHLTYGCQLVRRGEQ